MTVYSLSEQELKGILNNCSKILIKALLQETDNPTILKTDVIKIINSLDIIVSSGQFHISCDKIG